MSGIKIDSDPTCDCDSCAGARIAESFVNLTHSERPQSIAIAVSLIEMVLQIKSPGLLEKARREVKSTVQVHDTREETKTKKEEGH